MGTNGVGKEEVTTALGRGRMSGHVRGARPRMGPADGVHERGQWRVGHERGQWRAGHMSGANGGWRTNVFQLKCGVKSNFACSRHSRNGELLVVFDAFYESNIWSK
uniref:Uncharacterized protein n=1 Tax=Globodera rostochiensis TaxID=31243 RepID=A0A914HR20_GLORO